MKHGAVPGEFSARLEKLYGSGLVSVILYGSATTADYRPGHSDINIAIVLTDASLPLVAKTSSLFRERAFRDIRPLFFTEDYIKTSIDVFPIEFLDMKENYIVLYGRDCLAGLEVDTKNLRFQCEQEIKSRLLSLKSAYARTVTGTAARALVFRSCSSMLHIMRNLIRLRGKTPPYPKEQIISAIEKDFGMDGAALREILEAKRTGRRLGHAAADRLLAGLAEVLERASKLVDTL